jgi:hypothetical protein
VLFSSVLLVCLTKPRDRCRIVCCGFMFAMSPAGVPEPSRRAGTPPPPVLYLYTRGGAENEATAVTATPAQTRNQICMGRYVVRVAGRGWVVVFAGWFLDWGDADAYVNCSSHLIYQFHLSSHPSGLGKKRVGKNRLQPGRQTSIYGLASRRDTAGRVVVRMIHRSTYTRAVIQFIITSRSLSLLHPSVPSASTNQPHFPVTKWFFRSEVILY